MGSFGAFSTFADLVHVVSQKRKRLIVVLSFYLHFWYSLTSKWPSRASRPLGLLLDYLVLHVLNACFYLCLYVFLWYVICDLITIAAWSREVLVMLPSVGNTVLWISVTSTAVPLFGNPLRPTWFIYIYINTFLPPKCRFCALKHFKTTCHVKQIFKVQLVVLNRWS